MFSGIMNYATSQVKGASYSIASALGQATWAGTKIGARIGWEVTKVGAKVGAQVGWEATKAGARVGWEATKLAARATSSIASAGVDYLIPDDYSSTDEFVDALVPKGDFLSVQEHAACEDFESLFTRAKTLENIKENYPWELPDLLTKHGSANLSKAFEITQQRHLQGL